MALALILFTSDPPLSLYVYIYIYIIYIFNTHNTIHNNMLHYGTIYCDML